MESAGLVTRVREAANKRIVIVRLTDAGEEMFDRLRGAAVAFDNRLRAGLTDNQQGNLERTLALLQANATAATSAE
ncbi:MAG: hypothetical protein WCB04_05935 [Mycobacteriales bacterium]